MSKNVISASLVAGLLALWLGSGLFTEAPENTDVVLAAMPERSRQGLSDEPLSRVRVVTANAELRNRSIVLRGRTDAKRVIDVTAEVAGQVVAQPAERGMQVAKGDLLCEIAIDDREIAVDEARAGLEKARIEHEGSLQLADQGLLSEVAIAASASRQETAKAHLRRQELNLARTRITAPFDGVVEDLHLYVGDYAMPGAACATLIDLDPMLVTAQVTEEEVESLQLGSAVLGSTRVGRDIEGTLSFVGKQSDPVTRTYAVEITVDNSDYQLRSGLTVSLRVLLEEVAAHRVAPSLLTLNDNGEMGVRLIDKDDRVIFRTVSIIEDGPDGVWIAGLPPQIRLITVGQEYVSVGARVEPVLVDDTISQVVIR